MRICFCADSHLHEWAARATVNKEGRNSRLQNGLDCLTQAARMAGRKGVLVVAGDIFHDRTSLKISVINAAISCIQECADIAAAVVLVAGNHDQFNRVGDVHSLSMFRHHPNVHLVPDDGTVLTFGESKLFLHPHTLDHVALERFIARAAKVSDPGTDFLVIHQGIQTAWMNSAKMDTDGLPAEALHRHRFAAVIAGHYHKPQTVHQGDAVIDGRSGAVYYCGSPYQQDWAETGQEKRFLVCEAGQVASVAVQGMPRFVRYSLDEWEAQQVKDPAQASIDFVELVVGSLEEARELNLPDNVLPVVRGVETVTQTQELSSFSTSEAVKVWMKSRASEHLIERALSRLPA